MLCNFSTQEEKELSEVDGFEVVSPNEAQRKPSDVISDHEEEKNKLLS